MSIFGNIMDKIFNRKSKTTQATQPSAASGAQSPQMSGGAPSSTAAAQPRAQVPPPQAMQAVDVEEVLNDMASAESQKLNWRTSIVDLMKLLDLDSSLSARKELAQELNYSGDMYDSTTMNIWLHKQVMKKLAENGGKVPADLKD